MDRPVEITRSYAECKFCNDIADMCNEIPDCTHCENGDIKSNVFYFDVCYIEIEYITFDIASGK